MSGGSSLNSCLGQGHTEVPTSKIFLQPLHLWVHDINAALRRGEQLIIPDDVVNGTCQLIRTIASCVQFEYPFYTKELSTIASTLFIRSFSLMTPWTLDSIVFGELFLIERHLSSEQINLQFWNNIHPRINAIAQSLYADGHFASAAEKAVKEVETRLRELFVECRPEKAEPSKVGDIIGALLSENGIYQFVGISTPSGKDYRRGIQLIFEGMFAAYRNPSAHKNMNYSQRESVEQIVLASQLMCVLDNQ